MRRLILTGALILLGPLALLALPRGADALTADHTDCSFCHSIHGAPGFYSLLAADNAEAVCMSCHGPGGSSSLKADVHRDSGSTFRFTCNVCHDSHSYRDNWQGGTNIKLIGRDTVAGTGFYPYAIVNTPNSGIKNVTFESRGDIDAGEPTLHSFADGDEDGVDGYDGICEVCHTSTSFHRNNSSGDHTHQVGETCTRCHEHTGWFMGP